MRKTSFKTAKKEVRFVVGVTDDVTVAPPRDFEVLSEWHYKEYGVISCYFQDVNYGKSSLKISTFSYEIPCPRTSVTKVAGLIHLSSVRLDTPMRRLTCAVMLTFLSRILATHSQAFPSVENQEPIICNIQVWYRIFH
jgi:hypothetical protein